MTRRCLSATAIAAAVAALVAVSLLASFLTGGSSIMAGSATGPFAYVANLSSGQVSVIDLPTETEVTAIVTGGEPYWVAISADGSTVAASLHTDGVALIDGTTNSLIGVVASVGSEPEAVAVDSDGSTVYVGDENSDVLYAVDQRDAGAVVQARCHGRPVRAYRHPVRLSTSGDCRYLGFSRQVDNRHLPGREVSHVSERAGRGTGHDGATACQK